ncbi:MAG: hypothetical protein KJ574_02170 [Nanoarchaeota archaeon]|nr:hypothetical protein [Nanoarchaeota archaeon]
MQKRDEKLKQEGKKDMTVVSESIKIRKDTKQALEQLKLVPQESFDNVIQRLVVSCVDEDLEISDSMKRVIESRLQNVKEGKVYSLKEFRNKLAKKDV